MITYRHIDIDDVLVHTNHISYRIKTPSVPHFDPSQNLYTLHHFEISTLNWWNPNITSSKRKTLDIDIYGVSRTIQTSICTFTYLESKNQLLVLYIYHRSHHRSATIFIFDPHIVIFLIWGVDVEG